MDKREEYQDVFRPISSYLSIAPLSTDSSKANSESRASTYSTLQGSFNYSEPAASDISDRPFAPAHRTTKKARAPDNFTNIKHAKALVGQAPPKQPEENDTSDKNSGQSLLSPARDLAFIFTVCIAQFLALGGTMQTIAPLGIIASSFGVTDPAKMSWLTAAYALTFGTFILPAGRLGDIYGHKKMYLIGFLWFGVWSLVLGCSYYTSYIMFAVCRGLQGIGPAMIAPNALALVGRVYANAEKKKHMVFAFYGASAPTGATLSAFFAAMFAQLVWWPWAFWAMSIACFATCGVAYFVIPNNLDQLLSHESKETSSQSSGESDEEKADGKTQDDAPKENEKLTLDVWGCLTGVTGLVLFNFAWNQAPVAAWSVNYVIATLVLGCAFLTAFIIVEWKFAKHPLVPVRQLTVSAWLGLGVVGAGWSSFGIWTFYIWRTIERVRSQSPLTAVAQNAPVAVSGLLASVVSGCLLNHTKVQYILLASMSCFLTGQALIATMPLNQIYWAQLFVSIVVMPWGMDMSFPSGTAIVSAGLPEHLQGTAGSLVNTIVNYSISMGLGFAGTILKNLPPKDESPLALLESYRNAWHFGIGLDGLGFAIALYFVVSRSNVVKRWMGSGSKS